MIWGVTSKYKEWSNCSPPSLASVYDRPLSTMYKGRSLHDGPVFS
jgi:hypothetical protein